MELVGGKFPQKYFSVGYCNPHNLRVEVKPGTMEMEMDI